MRPAYRLRMAANLLNGSSLTGIAVARLGGAGLRRGGDGLLVASGYRLPVPPAPSFCLGNVLVTRLGHAAFTGDTPLVRHEARHATQYACCGGLAMLPLYGAAAAVSWVLTGDFASRNVFERQAGLAAGGYRETDLRPFLRSAAGRAAGTGRRTRRRAGRGALAVTAAPRRGAAAEPGG